jgi:hypothetical protein
MDDEDTIDVMIEQVRSLHQVNLLILSSSADSTFSKFEDGKYRWCDVC